MTPELAGRVLKVVDDDPTTGEPSTEEPMDGLSPVERRFAEEYFGGEFAHNGTRSYMLANPNANYNTSSIEAGRLLRLTRVQKYLRELHRQALDSFTAEGLRPWSDFLPLCQRVIAATAEGRLKSRLALEAACYLTNRALGAPTTNIEVQVLNRERIAGATKAFMGRVAEEVQRKRLVSGSVLELPVTSPGGSGAIGELSELIVRGVSPPSRRET